MRDIPVDRKHLQGLTFIDLFAGLGGFRLALESLGGTCVYSNEWDKYAQETYNLNFGEIPDGDITKVDEKSVPDHDILCGGFPCFPAGTPILTATGMKPIEEIQPGDMVMTHKGRYRKVVRTGVKENASTIILHSTGASIECTPNHPFLTSTDAQTGLPAPIVPDGEEKWVEAQLMVGKKWLSVFTDADRREDGMLGKWFPVIAKERGHEGVTVYNMEVEEDHSYIAGGLAVHNCQAFSISGKQRGFEEARGTLFFDIARIVAEKRPKMLFLENVKNLAQHDGGKTIKVIESTIRELGYTFDYKVMEASEYGCATNRPRCYMICFRGDLGVAHFEFPAPTGSRQHVAQHLLWPTDALYDELKDEVEKLWCEREDISIAAENPYIAGTKPMRVGTVGKGGQGERIYSINAPGITLSAYGGGQFAKTGGYYIDNKVRKLHPRECARLMGYPDSYIYNPRPTQAYKQFGNSVVVDVLQIIAEEMGRVYREAESDGASSGNE